MKEGVQWHFNTPAASHHGGAWERMIRSVRTVINTLAPKQANADKTLLSLFTDVEFIVNSRPTTPVKFTEIVEKPLTPNDLLILNPSNDMILVVFVLFCFVCHIYPPFTRKRIVSLYFGPEVRTRLGVVFFEVYGPPVFHIKVGRPVKCLAQGHNKRTCRLVLYNLH